MPARAGTGGDYLGCVNSDDGTTWFRPTYSQMMADPSAATRFAQARVARLATVTADLIPHLVPVVFASVGDTIYTAVDGKPKSTRRLRRLENIAAHPSVSLLVDHYDEDWTTLWWVRADGTATIHDGDEEMRSGLSALRRKYTQYGSVALTGPLIAIAVTRWTAWPS